ncbi:MAG: DNA polymerase III subunit delta [Breznakia sp.]
MFVDKLQNQQTQVYTILQNALVHSRLAHAYMFVGDKTAPKKECAFLMAQSLVCQHTKNGFACETCDACRRVLAENYADMLYLDGNEASIKKENILSLKKEFVKTNQEGYGKKIYIIDHAENATSSAMNSILTFLEEPQNETIAIFIVDQIELVLDTIKSRCQILHFHKQNREAYRLQLAAFLDAFDADMLSYKTSSKEQAIEMQESDEYQHAAYMFKEYVAMLIHKDRKASIFLQNEGITKGKRNNRVVFAYFLDMLDILANDTLLEKEVEDSNYNKSIKALTKEQALVMKKVSNEIQDKNIKSVNMNLLVDEFIVEMERVYG